MAKKVQNNAKSLVIVESPAKAKTIEKYLGEDFHVTSSVGHIRDLKKRDMSINIDNGFEPEYVINPDKTNVVNDLKRLAKNADTIWLATDEDREGEAIAWHLYEALELQNKETKRIVFHEITKPAILKAIKEPRSLDIDLINAQQARRIIDRLVGYELSPVLWKKVKPGLSAGRVQSVSVRLIVEREREINEFMQSSSYKITAIFTLPDGKSFNAELKRKFDNYDDAYKFLEKIANSEFSISDIQVKPTKKSPAAPFTTSTLQQEANRKFSFAVKQTMSLAQKLYESGYITYMRTDSLNLSDIALNEAATKITSDFGENFHKLRKYKTSSASAQEAHEAIRPTNMNMESISGDKNLVRLYELIWKRTIASQMADAEIEKTTATILISNSSEIFIASGEVIKFEGFLKLYLESTDDSDEEDENTKMLPAMKVGSLLKYERIQAKEVFRKSPARYAEASLVKKLEEMGIGRPSTYAPTISTIQDRGYVEKLDKPSKDREYNLISLVNGEISTDIKKETFGAEKGKLFPTNIGMIVNDFLVKFFPDIVDFNFTKLIEEEFDEIASGKKVWKNVVAEFYTPFHKTVEDSGGIQKSMATSKDLGIDPKTGKMVSIRAGKYGPMLQLGDTNDNPKFASIPEDKNLDTITLEDAVHLFDLPKVLGKNKDGEEVTVQVGRFGPYIKVGKTNLKIDKDEVFTITLEEALSKLENKATNNQNAIQSFEDGKILVLKGRFGPYVSDGTKNAKIPRTANPETITLEECVKLLSNSGNNIKTFEEQKIQVLKGRFGPYITDGKVNATIPKAIDPEKITLEECIKLLEAKAVKSGVPTNISKATTQPKATSTTTKAPATAKAKAKK